MAFQGDERAQSVQVGAVLLFAVLIVAFSSYQAFVIPNQNSEIEFNHNQQVHSQMQDLRNAIVSVPGASSSTSVSIQLGTRYPSRAIAQNPGPPTGSLRTNGTTDESKNVTISNAEATGETGDYWDGTNRSFNSGTLVYSPNYNVYGQAPDTYYEHSVAYNQFREGTIFLSGQTLVDGREISLVALNGSVSRTASGSTAVDVRPVSRSTRTVRVTNTAGEQINVTVLSRLSASQWENDILEDELTDNGGYVTGVTKTGERGPFNKLTVSFEAGVDYRLRLAKAGVGTRVTDEEAAYLTSVTTDGRSVDRGDSVELQLEVRDAYNNPVSDATVNGSVVGSNNGTLAESQLQTDEDGQVTFTYETTATNDTGTHDVDFTIGPSSQLSGGLDGSSAENVSLQVTVESQSTSGGRLVSEADAQAYDANGDDVPGGVNLTVRNTADGAVRLTDVAVSPENSTINGLSEEGAGQGELTVEATDGSATRTVDLPLTAGSEYGYVSDRGLTLSTETSRDERIYDTGSGSFEKATTDLRGSDVELGAGDAANVSFAEFWSVDTGSDVATSVNVTDETLHLTLTYATGGQRVADTFAVTVAPPAGPGVGPGTVFASSGELSTVDTQGRIARYGVTSTTYVGPQDLNLAFGSTLEVPYRANGAIGITNIDGDVRTLVSSNAGDGPLALGNVSVGNNNDYLTGTGPYIYYIDGDGELARVDSGGTSAKINGGNGGIGPIQAQSVAGTGDIDSDGVPELIYTDSNGEFAYVNDKNNGKAEILPLAGSPAINTPTAVGQPADLDGDGADEIPYINGSGDVRYINGPDGNDAEGSRTTLATGAGGENPVGTEDVDGDGTQEVVYVDESGTSRLAYADPDPGDSNGFVLDENGDEIPADSGPGAA